VGVSFEYDNYQLRDLELDDAQELFTRFTSRFRVMKYLPIKVHTDIAETKHLISEWLRFQSIGVYVNVIQSKIEKRLVGVVGAARFEHTIALSMQIAPDRHSMGAGCIVGPAIVHSLLSHPEIKRLWAYSDVDNVAVINMLHNMGCKCEGLMRKYEVHPNISPEPRDCLLWSVIR
jgi:RimJ/RimL family protein N-acetyltransferase